MLFLFGLLFVGVPGGARPPARRAGRVAGATQRAVLAHHAAGGRAQGRRGPLPHARRLEQLHGVPAARDARRRVPRLRGPEG